MGETWVDLGTERRGKRGAMIGGTCCRLGGRTRGLGGRQSGRSEIGKRGAWSGGVARGSVVVGRGWCKHGGGGLG